MVPFRLTDMTSRLAEARAVAPAAAVCIAGIQRGRPFVHLDKAGADTRFHLCSNSKAVLAAVVDALAQNGQPLYQLTLSNVLETVLGSCPARLRAIQLADLLAMRAGLIRVGLAEWGIDAAIPDADRIACADAMFDPLLAGHFGYSNMSYILARICVEQVTGQPLAELARQHIFHPLGMQGAWFGWGNSPKVAVPHAAQADCLQPTKDPTGGSYLGSAGVHWTADDALRWIRHCLDALHEAGSDHPAAVRVRTADAYPTLILPGAKQAAYCAGWGRCLVDGVAVFMHGGAVPGFRAQSVVVPELRSAVAIYAATTSTITLQLAYQFLADLFELDDRQLLAAAAAGLAHRNRIEACPVAGKNTGFPSQGRFANRVSGEIELGHGRLEAARSALWRGTLTCSGSDAVLQLDDRGFAAHLGADPIFQARLDDAGQVVLFNGVLGKLQPCPSG